jgi:cytochrome c peroxidase
MHSTRGWLGFGLTCVVVVVLGLLLGKHAVGQRGLASLSALPPVPIPPDNPQTPVKVELGKLLYFDPRLSGDATTSCASCHMPTLGWGDGGDLSRGYPATLHWRNSQTILNTAYLTKWFWTGASSTLEAQAKAAMTGPLAQNMNPALAEERLKQIPGYVALFQEAFGEAPSFDRALNAIAAFERTIVSRNVPFDRYVQGKQTALTAEQIKGLGLFQGQAGCIQCHHGPMLTDEAFHNLGVPKHPAFEAEPLRQIAMRERMKSKGVPEATYRTFDRDPGRYLDTKRDEDQGKFRTPPLRELGYTAPYMHNGVFKTLEEVIDFYAQGGGADPFGTKSPLLKPLALTTEEKAALLAFLKSLDGDAILVEPPTLPAYEVLPLPSVSPPGTR